MRRDRNRPQAASSGGLPRYIKPETVMIGDTLRVTRKEGDVTYSKTGTVASRAYEGAFRAYYSAEGHELLRWRPDQTTPTVTLIHRVEQSTAVPLDGFDEVKEQINGNSESTVR